MKMSIYNTKEFLKKGESSGSKATHVSMHLTFNRNRRRIINYKKNVHVV